MNTKTPKSRTTKLESSINGGEQIRDRVNRLISWLEQGLVERGEVVKLALLALVSGESLFLLGPPGTAKSLISRKVSGLLKDEEEYQIKRFNYLMGRYSTPEDLFGPISIKGLKEDRCERKTEGYLPTAHVVFLDEIWKANPAIQNALLTALNEKLYRNGTREEAIPLELCIGASNELPAKGAGLGAIWDRFLIRAWVGNVTDDESFTELMNVALSAVSHGQDTLDDCDLLSLSELKSWRNQVHQVKLPKYVMNLLLRLRKRVTLYNEELADFHEDQEEFEAEEDAGFGHPIYVSDRRWVKVGHLLRTVSFLSGRDEVLPQDLWVAPYCMWDRPEQRSLVSRWVMEELGDAQSIGSVDFKEIVSMLRPHVQDVMDELESTVDTLTALQQDHFKRTLSKPIRSLKNRTKVTKTAQERELLGSPFLLGEALDQRKRAYASSLTSLSLIHEDLQRLRSGLDLPKDEIRELCELLENRLEAREDEDENRCPICYSFERPCSLHPELSDYKRKAGDVVTSRVKGVDFQMVYCPEGTFTMGGDGRFDGKPKHRVELTRPFLMGQTQVTQAQWEAVMGNNPSKFKGPQLPVEQVNWFDCVRFLNALSEAEGLTPVYSVGLGDEPTVNMSWEANGYRLPTEAEWEYSAKAGTDLIYSGSNSIDEVAWCHRNSGSKTRPVGQKKPNSWGLYDMSGNVWEWCNDEWDSDRYKGRTGTTKDPRPFASAPAPRVFRGGDWWNDPARCRVAFRYWDDPGFRGIVLGFRFLRWNFDT